MHFKQERAVCLRARTACDKRTESDATPAREGAITTIRARPEVTDKPFTHQELILAKNARDTAAGADGVTYTMHAGSSGEAAVLALVNCSWVAGRLPSARKATDIQPIPKPRNPTRPRPISLMSCTAKTAERMVLTHLQWCLGPLHPHVFGFTRGVGTADSIMALLSYENNRPAVTVFLDLEKPSSLPVLTPFRTRGSRKVYEGGSLP